METDLNPHSRDPRGKRKTIEQACICRPASTCRQTTHGIDAPRRCQSCYRLADCGRQPEVIGAEDVTRQFPPGLQNVKRPFSDDRS
jgi:hypothetical protein